MRFSRNLQDKLSKLTPEDKLTELIRIYLTGTSICDCSLLFQCKEEHIIIALKSQNLYEYKTCSKCKEIKPFSDFYSNDSMGINTNRCGVSCQCRKCVSENGKSYFKNNQKKKQEYDTKYKQQDHIKKERLEYQKQYLSIQENRDKRNKYMNNKYHTDIAYKIRTCISVYINKQLRLGKQNETVLNMLDFTLTELMQHLESLFDVNMNWNNYGSYWEIDHIVPVSSFIINNYEDEDFKKCWSLKNLQPLSITDNRSKKDNINETWNNLELAKEFQK